MWYPAAAQNVAQNPLPRRSSSNAYDVKDADAALESFNPVRKAQKAESSFSAIVRTRSDVLPSVSQRQLQRKRTSEVDVGFALARDEHKRKNRRIDLTGLARVLGNRSYEDDRVLLNPGKRSENDDFQKHSSASLIKNEVKVHSPRVLLDSIKTDIPASKVAQAESQNGNAYTTSHISNAAKSAQAVAERVSSQIVTQKDVTSTPEATHTYPPIDPADQNPPCCILYVRNLPIDAAEDELKGLFSKQPGYKRLVFRTKQNGPMCFVEFEDMAFATKALSELYGYPLHNSIKGGIQLSFSKIPLGVRVVPPRNVITDLGGDREGHHDNGSGYVNHGAEADRLLEVDNNSSLSHFGPEPEYSIFVGDFGPEVSEKVLASLFQIRFASYKSVKIMSDPISGLSRGYGFVRFTNLADQERALDEMQGVYCGNRPMRISPATPKSKIGGSMQAINQSKASNPSKSSFVELSNFLGGPNPDISFNTNFLKDSRGMVAMSQDITPGNIYSYWGSSRSSSDFCGFPSTHSAHSSISSASTYPSYYNGSVAESSVTDYSSTSESVGLMTSRTLPRPSAISIRQHLLSGTYKTGAVGIFKETEPVLCIKYTISEDMTKGEQARNKARLSAIADRPRILGSKRSSVLGFAHGRTGIEAHRNHATLLLKDRPGFFVPSREDLQKKALSNNRDPYVT